MEPVPKFVRFSYDASKLEEDYPISANVAFQKEVFTENWNMIHVTEISFTVLRDDFEEFEKMSGVSFTNDFKDLTSITFCGKDRRKNKRE